MSEEFIATLDLTDFRNASTRPKFVAQLRESLSETGFFFLSNHGINETIISDALEVLPWFFDEMTEEERMRYVFTDLMGYTPMGVEKGEDAVLADHKHYWHVRDRVS